MPDGGETESNDSFGTLKIHSGFWWTIQPGYHWLCRSLVKGKGRSSRLMGFLRQSCKWMGWRGKTIWIDPQKSLNWSLIPPIQMYRENSLTRDPSGQKEENDFLPHKLMLNWDCLRAQKTSYKLIGEAFLLKTHQVKRGEWFSLPPLTLGPWGQKKRSISAPLLTDFLLYFHSIQRVSQWIFDHVLLQVIN